MSTLQNLLNPPNYFPHFNGTHTEAAYRLNVSCCLIPSSRDSSTCVKSPFNLHLYQTEGAAAENCCCYCPRNCCLKTHWFSVQKKGSNICICDFCGFGSTPKHQDKRCVCYALFSKMLPAAREMGGILHQNQVLNCTDVSKRVKTSLHKNKQGCVHFLVNSAILAFLSMCVYF